MATVKTHQDRLVPHQELTAFSRGVFDRIQCSSEIAESVVYGLVETSLDGVDTHGIRLLPAYAKAGLEGRANLNPKIKIEDTASATTVLDGDKTYGMYSTRVGMSHALELAGQHGIAAVAIRNSFHFGAAGLYVLPAAHAGFLGFCFTNSSASVVPTGGKTPMLGTNPIAFGAPCEGEEPFRLDMATSQTTWNNVLLHRATGLPLEPGWAVDTDGKPTTDPHLARTLVSAGGYKGYGLGLMVDILSGLLTGMDFGPHVAGLYPKGKQEHLGLGHFLIAINISSFVPLTVFAPRMKEMLDGLRSTQPVNEAMPVLVPNDPQKATRAERLRDGVPIPMAVVDDLRTLAKDVSIEPSHYPLLLGM